jgi:hypothetical protein
MYQGVSFISGFSGTEKVLRGLYVEEHGPCFSIATTGKLFKDGIAKHVYRINETALSVGFRIVKLVLPVQFIFNELITSFLRDWTT